LTADEALKHRWIKEKNHKKLNLQKSISSNWSNSCVSLKNEKGLKRHVKASDFTNPSKISPNSGKKATYGAVDPIHDDKSCTKESYEKARSSEGDKDLQRHHVVSTGTVDAPNSNTSTNRDESGEMDENVALKRAQEKRANENVKNRLNADLKTNHSKSKKNEPLANGQRRTNLNRKSSKTASKVSPLIVHSKKNTRPKSAAKRAPSALESPARSKPEDCNGNLDFVERIPPTIQHVEPRVEPRVDDTMSSQRNDSGEDEEHVNELSHLKRTKTNNRASFLPPIQSSVVSSLVTVSNTVK
jgi:hypothetical protein